jgi:hypothetical protein
MKFTDAWDSLAKENRLHKRLTTILFLMCSLLALGWTAESFKPPLVFDRGCDTRAVTGSNDAVTQDEIKEFLKVALAARFNSNVREPLYLSLNQQALRNQEQHELEQRSMRQTVIVQDVQFDKDKILVQADRLISVGEIRSAFRFPLNVKIEKESRSSFNPYGLVLASADTISDKESKK